MTQTPDPAEIARRLRRVSRAFMAYLDDKGPQPKWTASNRQAVARLIGAELVVEVSRYQKWATFDLTDLGRLVAAELAKEE